MCGIYVIVFFKRITLKSYERVLSFNIFIVIPIRFHRDIYEDGTLHLVDGGQNVIVCPSVRLGLTIVKFSYLLVQHRETAVYAVK